MLFNSIDFALFLPIVFFIYWFIVHKSLKLQNLFVVVASYLFYGWWDYRFLSLIIFSTVIDYGVGMYLSKTLHPSKRKILLLVSIIVNLGFLGFFKYYNFFLDNFTTAFTFFGSSINASSLKIILPVGISFYTFQTLSYSIDVYRKKMDATKDFISFAAFVGFFPQLVAGPIERAANLLPQFYKKRSFNYGASVDGLKQILWGLFKKIVIADNCAVFSDIIFNNSETYSGFTLVFGALFFAFQIYGDFSGYSDIAIGTARLFGFNLMQNFAFPYFSRDIAEFWRRWHISLSTWFRDYVYIPLGGSKCGSILKIRNIFIIFVVSGFWHGANWTFIVWGALNALFFLPIMFMNKNRQNIEVVAYNKILPSLWELLQITFTFSLTLIAWIFFRAKSLTHAFNYISDLANGLFFKQAYVDALNFFYWDIGFTLPILIGVFVCIEWIGRREQYAIAAIGKKYHSIFRWIFYYIIIGAIFYFAGQPQDFIYFQF